ncbi:hypothetical protein J2S00_003157 [Caldalkalibacillus uzonensis]|uniref:Uncharacterized protein n=1 Tax=Caldalkalibacillus uzonensis TaxID=353224 RepID=A0ABU0CVA8_9BACI|nr:hypothetical protein [Caldalkalibacillus uzonensis]MDQ0340348.1 hypothetical protein [Caldalkalibacillus uzonensis]
MECFNQPLECERLQPNDTQVLQERRRSGIDHQASRKWLQSVINRTVQQYITRPQNRHTGLMCLYIFGSEYTKERLGFGSGQSILADKLPMLTRRLLESLCYVLWSQHHQKILVIQGIVGHETLTPAGKKQYHFYVADDTLVSLEELYQRVYQHRETGNQEESEVVVHFLLEDRKVLLKHRPTSKQPDQTKRAKR